jgi:hypothetical protein
MKGLHVDYFEVSAKTGDGLNDAFLDLAHKMVAQSEQDNNNYMMSFLPGERHDSGNKFKLSMVQNVQKQKKRQAKCC